MGVLSDLKAMADVQRIKNGGKARLSVSQITCLIVNMSDARQFLSKDQFDKVFELFRRLRKVKKKKKVDILGYYEIAGKIVLRFNMIAPFKFYSGDSPESAELLVESLLEQYGDLDALDIETEIFGVPRYRSKKAVVILSVFLAAFVALSAASSVLLYNERQQAEKYQDKISRLTNQCNNTAITRDAYKAEVEELEKVEQFWGSRFVLVSPTGEKYHCYGCSSIDADSCTALTFDQATSKGYSACSKCSPDWLRSRYLLYNLSN